MKRKNIDINDKKLWKNLGIDNPSANLDENLDKFYNKYNNFFPGRERGRILAIAEVKNQLTRDPKILLKIFLSYLENEMKNPDFYSAEENRLNLRNLPYYENAIFRRLRRQNKNNKEAYLRPLNYPSAIHFEDSDKTYIIFKKNSNRSEKKSKQRDYYEKFIEKIIVITKKDKTWLIRHSFSKQSEKRVLKMNVLSTMFYPS